MAVVPRRLALPKIGIRRNRDLLTPQGIHKAIWDQFVDEEFELPAEERLTLAAYDAGPPPAAYVNFVAVGEALPEMPIFLKPEFYVLAPLEESYRTTWDDFFPDPMKPLLAAP